MDKKTEKTVEKYTRLMEDKELTAIQFVNGSVKDNVFRTRQEGFVFELPMPEVFGSVEPENYKYHIPSRLNTPIEVLITGIDPERKLISCKYTSMAEKRVKKLREEINAALDKGQEYRCPARVVYISEAKNSRSFCYVSLRNNRLFGIIDVADWSTEYTIHMKYAARVGDIVEVCVTDHNDTKIGPSFCEYKCSRAKAMANVWEGIDGFIHPQDICTVRIFSEWKRDSFFCGRIDGIPEVNVRVLVPKVQKNFSLYVGASYVCKVKKANQTGHVLEVEPIRPLISDKQPETETTEEKAEEKKEDKKPRGPKPLPAVDIPMVDGMIVLDEPGED